MGKSYRIIAAVVAAGLVLSVSIVLILPATGQPLLPRKAQAFAQPVFPGQPNDPNNSDSSGQDSAVKLFENSKFRNYLRVAQDCIADKAWNDAVTALQLILDSKEDYYVRVKAGKARGKESERWASVKFEANQLLGTMPQEGLNVYELRFGGAAQAILNEAKKTGDVEKLAEVAQRYLHTKAGPEANELLATYFMDRGQFFSAALRFDRLFALPKVRYKVSDLTLLKAVLAYRRAGDLKNSERLWQKLTTRLRGNGGMKLGGQYVSTADLSSMLRDLPRPRTASLHDWTLVRGNLTNSAQANGSQPLLDEVLWQRPTVQDFNEVLNPDDPPQDPGKNAKDWIDRAIEQARGSQALPVMPGFFPIAVNGKLIYRNHYRIVSVALHPIKDESTGEVLVKPGELDWFSTQFGGSLTDILEKGTYQPTIDAWLRTYQQSGGLNLVYENSLVGTLSSDLQRVYAVDDLAVPIPANQSQLLNPRFGNANLNNNIKQLIYNNTLYAYNINTGKIAWRRGGFDKTGHVSDPKFEDSLFLGPPLPVGGKLYVLNETKDGDLRLVCLDPDHKGKVIPPIQSLGVVDSNSRMYLDANRRIHAVHLAYGEGILVCPTNAGQVFGVDLLSRTLAWAYPYREGNDTSNQVVQPGFPGGGFPPGRFPGAAMPLPLTSATWKVAPPVIQNGMVVFTAPDAKSIHCLNLRDGSLVWKRARKDTDLFMAGVWNGKVLIVGKNNCYARDLRTGQLWKTATEAFGSMPSGQGVASNNIYYLPLQSGEIVAIDLDNMRIKSRNRPISDSTPKPGNLVFYEGMVLSQTPLKVVAYPQLEAKLELVRAAVKKNPNDLAKLTELGELLLFDGQVKKAVERLRDVNAKNPPKELHAKVRQRLYEALTDLFQVDFKTASTNYMDEYEKLLKVPADSVEEQRRKGRFLRILGEGREHEGNLVAAYRAYRDFGAVKLFREEGVPSMDDPTRKVPMDVWLRTRIATMFAKARAEKRQPLEARIQEDWMTLRDTKDLDKIRSFVSMFDLPFPVGRQARLYLANAIIEKNDAGSFLDVELKLEQLRGEQYRHTKEGGQALEALARLEMKKGTANGLKTAVAYYRQLAEEFPDTIIRDNKTGKQLFNELATNRTLLAYLNTRGPNWGNSPIKAQELNGDNSNAGLYLGFVLRPKGDVTPATHNLRLLLNTNNSSSPQLTLVDLADQVANKEDRKTIRLEIPSNNHQLLAFFHNSVIGQAQKNAAFHPNATFRFFHVKGHLAVVQVCSEIYGIDLEREKILWHKTLVDFMSMIRQPNISFQGVTLDGEGNIQVMIYNRMLRRQLRFRIGEVGTVQAAYVGLIQGDELRVLSPLTGKVMWTRSEIAEGTQLFGNDRYLFLVDSGGGNARALRASDGTAVEVADFSHVYRNRLQIRGRRILAGTPENGQMVLRLYDIPNGKDVWKHSFPGDATVLHSENSNLTGVIESNGRLSIFSVKDGSKVLQTNILDEKRSRITKADLQNLDHPLLLADHDHFYLALNKPIDTREVMGGLLASNFANGLHCARVNGWFAAFHRHDGSAKIDGQNLTWKRGQMHWHSSKPITNQLVILEQFEDLPVVLFSVRYNKAIRKNFNTVRSHWISLTQSIDKRTGKWVYYPDTPRSINAASSGRFNKLVVDSQEGIVDMVGFDDTLRHYVDDGRHRAKREARPINKQTEARRPVASQPELPPRVPRANRVLRGGRFIRLQNGRIIRLPAAAPVPGK